ncbi:MAG: transcription-repair coupling factor [Ruminococcaceae bacterium]|nr:transcription-repair coupling factor [Oscillospiraceae bacterium]
MIYDGIRLDNTYTKLIKALDTELASPNRLPLFLTGVCGGADTALCCAMAKDRGPILILTGTERDAARMASGMNACGLRAAVFPGREPVLYNIAASRTSEYERLKVLLRLRRGELDAVIAVPGDAVGYTMPPDILALSGFTLKTGTEFDPTALDEALLMLGYVKCEMTEAPGQYARRGGIIDIYPSFSLEGETRPYRVEFFGDEVDRIGVFDPDTQRTEENKGEIFVSPARELLLTPEITEKIHRSVANLKKKAKTVEGEKELSSELTAIESGMPIDFADKYITLVYPQKCTLTDYFDKFRPVVVCGKNAMRQQLDAALWRERENLTALLESGTIDPKYAGFMEDEGYLNKFLDGHATVFLDSFVSSSGKGQGGLFTLHCRSGSVTGNKELILADIEDYLKTGYRIVIATASSHESEVLGGMLREKGVAVSTVDSGSIDCTALSQQVIYLTVLPGAESFELTSARFVFISLASLGEVKKGSLRRGKRKGKSGDTKKLTSYADLQVGDYVVHENCGIGRYLGIEQLTVDGVTKDYINIQYAGKDKLFIPTSQLDMVSKYIGAHSDDGLLKLSKMGGAEWKHAKSRAKSAVSDMAKELIKLYAERMRLPGYAFPKDDDYQREFELAFEYEETDSQIDAILDIKEDMQEPHPMDRLLCGDVGYGKTEVAFRAAFKAIEAGKQVALLCPTTILAYQHYSTALARMRDFPIRIEMISRFRTPTQQKEILRKLKRGDIDLIVGTHTLLYGKAEFKDLGLLIIDEEQRFGVAQKERLKQAAGGVDVLMLSATPIPRTLSMAIGGIRDMSILDTPPGDRQPVQTYVLEYDDLIIEDAIRRELSRGGQVFYLYNRTDTINRVAARIAERVPGARVAVAHGQMDKDEVEDVWRALVNAEIDVLVCTSIIETGVDVPNANTLIIEDADRLGLSQLHQLRGRVGRSGRRAFAYFTFREGKALTEIAEKRLNAIREYAQFGAGFRVALRDLEIRGAGNMLGAEQHGHLDAVGYDLYMKLLSEAVLEEKGEATEKKPECSIDIRVDAYIPESYISSPGQRIEQYKHIATIQTEEDADDIADALLDRYGEYPVAVENLLAIALIKADCQKFGFTRLEQREGQLIFHIPELDGPAWVNMFHALPDFRLRAAPGEPSRVFVQIPKKMTSLKAAQKLLETYALQVTDEKEKK